MKRVLGLTVVALTLTAGVAAAQQAPAPSSPGPRHEQHHPPGQGQGMMCPMMGGGGGMMGPGMMGGMPGMAGMMGGGPPDPRMMQMRGEMMKAMGDIMIKYGKMMEAPPSR